jgi:hypothetical protein
MTGQGGTAPFTFIHRYSSGGLYAVHVEASFSGSLTGSFTSRHSNSAIWPRHSHERSGSGADRHAADPVLAAALAEERAARQQKQRGRGGLDLRSVRDRFRHLRGCAASGKLPERLASVLEPVPATDTAVLHDVSSRAQSSSIEAPTAVSEAGSSCAGLQTRMHNGAGTKESSKAADGKAADGTPMQQRQQAEQAKFNVLARGIPLQDQQMLAARQVKICADSVCSLQVCSLLCYAVSDPSITNDTCDAKRTDEGSALYQIKGVDNR